MSLRFLLVFLLFQAPASQDTSFAEKAKAARESVGKPGTVPNSPQSFANAVAAAKKNTPTDQPKAPRVYTNDDIITRETKERLAREMEGSSYHQRAKDLWCSIDRIQSWTDSEKERRAAWATLMGDEAFRKRVNDQAAAISDPQQRAAYLKSTHDYTPAPIPGGDIASLQELQQSLHDQCAQDAECRMEWLEVTKEERTANAYCHQKTPFVPPATAVTNANAKRSAGAKGGTGWWGASAKGRAMSSRPQP